MTVVDGAVSTTPCTLTATVVGGAVVVGIVFVVVGVVVVGVVVVVVGRVVVVVVVVVSFGHSSGTVTVVWRLAGGTWMSLFTPQGPVVEATAV
ncbi:MAG: hypothetical protein E6G39_16525 [Actinobacteria bacterium]|nr:MAG: hypothetical protein E6G39_16525 [Actinomycetota bacterium]